MDSSGEITDEGEWSIVGNKIVFSQGESSAEFTLTTEGHLKDSLGNIWTKDES